MSTPVQAQITWPPPPIDQIERRDGTLARHQHPKDHEDLEVAVNAIIAVLGISPMGSDPNVTARLASIQTQLDALRAAQRDSDVAVIRALLLPEVAALREQLTRDLALVHPIHYQQHVADIWVVNHGLGYDPVLQVERDDGARILGFRVTYAEDHNSFTLSFSRAVAGRVLLAN